MFFWQERLCADWFIQVSPVPDKTIIGFAIHKQAHYRNACIDWAPPNTECWRHNDDAWCARAVLHELCHLLLQEIDEVIDDNLYGRWEKECAGALETVVDHVATALWRTLTASERLGLIRCFERIRLSRDQEVDGDAEGGQPCDGAQGSKERVQDS